MLENNLINVTNRDFVYTLVAQRIGGHLPKEIKAIYDSCEHVRIIATDCYFLHYALYPFLRNRNDDDVLEEVRRFLQDYMSDERYQRVKMLTTLDDEMSLVYSIALAKSIIGKVLGRLIGELELSQLMNPDSRVKSKIVNAVYAIADAGELGIVLDHAVEEAEEITKNANEIRELIGGKKAGKEAGTFKKVLDLAEHMLYVKFMKDIVTMSKRLSEYVPKASKILKRRGRFGDELSGYAITKRVERALPREIALPEELFLKKLTGEGFLMREKLSVAEGAYYILIDKCLDGETLITLRSGELVPIKDVKVGDEVLSVRFDRVRRRFYNVVLGSYDEVETLEPKLSYAKVLFVKKDYKDVLEIKTPFNSIKMTKNHVVPIFRYGKIVEIFAGDIRIGDCLFMPLLRRYHFGSKARILRPDSVIFGVGYRLTEKIGYKSRFYTKSFMLVPVTEIRYAGKTEVYDIVLEKDHHFIANGYVVHNSGSMHGEKTVWARSVAMALYRMAMTKKRRYFLRFFDTRVYPSDRPLDDPEEVVDAILKVKSNGGTDITNAISTALDDLIERGLSDYTNTVVIITDGEDVVQDLSRKLKRANASLISVMIQGDNETLKALSDQYMKAELSEIGGAKLLKIVESC